MMRRPLNSVLNASFSKSHNVEPANRCTDVRPEDPLGAFHVTDGRVVSGTNPASSTETAEAALEAFKKL